MNKKLNILLIAFLLTTNFAVADFYNGLSKPADFTGDSIIGAPTKELGVEAAPQKEDSGTIPPIKKLRRSEEQSEGSLLKKTIVEW